jgi:hypothetical protein
MMGTSNWQNIPYNIELIRKINPFSILDIGVGFGRWGMLFREFLEIWNNGNYTGKWNVRIDGVEIFKPYIKNYHSDFYDNIYCDDAYKLIDDIRFNYDVIFCGDVIEHFDKSTAVKFISKCLLKCDYLIINVPIGKNWKQDAINKNENEKHLSTWKKSDFSLFRYILFKKFRDYIHRPYIVVCITKNKEYLRKIKNPFIGKKQNFKMILKNKYLLYKYFNKENNS